MPERSSQPETDRLSRLAVALIGVTFLLGCPGLGSNTADELVLDPAAPLCENVELVLDFHCNRCHGATASDGAPPDLRLDVWDNPGARGAVNQSSRIVARSQDGTMPPITAPETAVGGEALQVLIDWDAAGAPIAPCTGGTMTDTGVDTGTDAGTDADVDTGADIAPDPTVDTPPDVPLETPLLSEVHAQVFTSCGNHHLDGGTLPWLGLNAELLERLSQPTNQLPSMPYITSGDSSQSYLWHKLSDTHGDAGGSGQRMPIGPPLSVEQLSMVQRWIDGGTPE